MIFFRKARLNAEGQKETLKKYILQLLANNKPRWSQHTKAQGSNNLIG